MIIKKLYLRIIIIIPWINNDFFNKIRKRYGYDHDLNYEFYKGNLTWDKNGYILYMGSFTYTIFDGWRSDNRKVSYKELEDLIDDLVDRYEVPLDYPSDKVEGEYIKQLYTNAPFGRPINRTQENLPNSLRSTKRPDKGGSMSAALLKEKKETDSLKEYLKLNQSIDVKPQTIEFVSVKDRIKNSSTTKNTKLTRSRRSRKNVEEKERVIY